ncbi:MAG: DUF1015 family protein [Acidobacteriota bacterium]|nr:DUF1015 family protein [Acidobacteriota bacterium]
MAAVRPFKALRPTPESAARVASVPYDVVSTEEARELASGNPLSFLRVTRSEIDFPAGADPYADAVYAKARATLDELRAAAPLVSEEAPAVYFYRLRMGDHEQTGVCACFSVDEYDRDLIKKHEKTRRDKEDDRTRHIVETRAQTGVVFLTYRAQASIDRLEAAACRAEPLFDITAPDGVRHQIWKVSGGGAQAVVDAFAKVPALYIADGHHRAASAARARTQLRTLAPSNAEPSNRETDWFIAVAFPDNQMQILPYHRLVKDLAGFSSTEEFLEKLSLRVGVTAGTAVPSGRGRVSMYLKGAWHELDLRALSPASADPADGLDVALLEHHVLRELLGVHDVRTDKRIDFVGGIRGTGELEARVNSGKAAVAFAMHPVTIDDLMTVSDTGGIMPPKSTWFEPKLRDGLLVHEI